MRVAARMLALLIVFSAGCNGGMFGGSTTHPIAETDVPAKVASAFVAAHPDARIDKAEVRLSNGPPFYRIHFHTGTDGTGLAEYVFDPDWFSPEARTSFISSHPSAVVDAIEFFEDVSARRISHTYRFHDGAGSHEQIYWFQSSRPATTP